MFQNFFNLDSFAVIIDTYETFLPSPPEGQIFIILGEAQMPSSSLIVSISKLDVIAPSEPLKYLCGLL